MAGAMNTASLSRLNQPSSPQGQSVWVRSAPSRVSAVAVPASSSLATASTSEGQACPTSAERTGPTVVVVASKLTSAELGDIGDPMTSAQTEWSP